MFIYLFLLGVPSSAADLQVRALYNDDTLRTYVSLPFQVKGVAEGFGALTSVAVTDSASCRTLLDPHIASNFFVKCTEPGTIRLSISYTVNGLVRRVTYGPLEIKKISEFGEVVTPGTESPSAEWLLGKDIYHNKKYSSGKTCANCHDNPAEKADRISVSSLTGAVNSVGAMRGISLTEVEKKVIVTYVQSFK